MLASMSLGKRLGIAFGLLVVLMLVIAGAGTWGLNDVAGQADRALTKDVPMADLSGRVGRSALDLRRYEKDYFLNIGAPEKQAEYLAKWRDARADLLREVAAIERLDPTPAEREKLQIMRSALTNYETGFERVLARMREGGLSTPQDANQAIAPFKNDIRDLEENASVFSGEKLQGVREEVDRTVSRALTLMLVLVGLVVLLGVLLSVVITRSVTLPVASVVDVAQAIAKGDLRTVEDNTRGDEIGRLMTAVAEMARTLRRVLGEIRSGAAALVTAGAQVSSTSQSLSQTTSEQAASVEEVTSSLEEMGSSITQNAENSKQMEGMATKGAKDAEEAGQIVKDTAEAMNAIADRIGLIEEIAYQTNLLALNAAIEAARAGEHGRGFSVVAASVNKIAERSQTAAKEIRGVAASSVQVAQRAGQRLGELVPAIRRTSDLVQEVAAASAEQSSGVSQMTTAMSQVDQVTQRNASAAEELAATAEEMNAQATALEQLSAFFRLSDQPEASRRDPAPAPRLEPPAVVRHPVASNGRAARSAQGGDHGFERF